LNILQKHVITRITFVQDRQKILHEMVHHLLKGLLIKMRTLKKLLARIAIAGITTLTSSMALATNIVNYTIAPQDFITITGEPSGGVFGVTSGTFTADFDSQQITAVAMSISITGDTTYVFHTPRAFGAYTDPHFPGITFYEADLRTNTPGILSAAIFYMDFLQNISTQLFPGHIDGVHTSFSTGHYVLVNTAGIVTNPSVPEPSTLLLMIVGAFAATRTQKYHRARY
jgi:hypothetical protein